MAAPLIGFDARPLLSRKTGIGFYVWHLLDALARLPHDCRFLLYTTNRMALPPAVARDPRFTVRQMPKMPGTLAAQTVVPLDLAARGADLFHGTNYAAPLASTCPILLTVHDLTTLSMPAAHRWLNRAGHAILPVLVGRARMIITDAASTRRELLARWPLDPDRVTAVHLAPGPRFTRPVSDAERRRVRRWYDLPERYILFVGTLEPRKNLAGLFRAFAAARQSADLAHHLVLVGGMGWGLGETMRLPEALGIRDRVRLLGYVPERDLPGLYAQAEMLVYPSLHEGFGLPPLEAMAVGTAVVTSNCSSLPEVVGEAAIQVDPTDDAAIAEALVRLAADKALRRRLARDGRERAARFTWEKTARETLRVYARALR